MLGLYSQLSHYPRFLLVPNYVLHDHDFLTQYQFLLGRYCTCCYLSSGL